MPDSPAGTGGPAGFHTPLPPDHSTLADALIYSAPRVQFVCPVRMPSLSVQSVYLVFSVQSACPVSTQPVSLAWFVQSVSLVRLPSEAVQSAPSVLPVCPLVQSAQSVCHAGLSPFTVSLWPQRYSTDRVHLGREGGTEHRRATGR